MQDKINNSLFQNIENVDIEDLKKMKNQIDMRLKELKQISKPYSCKYYKPEGVQISLSLNEI